MGKLEKYTAYKESGVKWLGEIPEHWEVKRLGTVGRFSASGIDKYINKNESLVKIINFTDIYSNTQHVLDSSIKYMEVTTPENNRVKHLVQKGDLIFLPSSETYEDLGLAALVNEELDNTSFSYHVIRLQFKKDIEHNFRKYLTNNNFALNQFSSYGKGTTRKIIGRNVFKNVRVIIPTKEEQTKIASFLDEKTSQIDNAISQKEKLIELLKERRQITINEAVTKGLDKDVEFKDSGVEWIGEIPKHWEIFSGLRVFSENKRKNTGMIDDRVLSLSYGRIIRKPKEKLVGLVPESFETYQIVKAGDIIIRCTDLQNDKVSLRTALAKDDGIITSAYLNLNVKYGSSEYLHYLLHILDITKAIYKLGSGLRQNLSFNDFKRLDIILPSIDEQLQIVKYIEIQTAKIDKAIELQQNYIAKLKEYKASLIDSVVTGKVRVA